MKNNFVFLNVTSNYPKQFTAGNTKMEYMATGIMELGHNVSAINSISSYTKENKDEIGISEKGIEYITLNSHKRFKGLYRMRQTYKLLKAKKTDGSNAVIMATSRTHKMLIDIFIAKLAGYKTLFLFHEWRGALKMHTIFHKIDAWLKDHFVIRFFDAYLPISHFLLDKCNDVSKKKPKLIVPIMADYTKEPTPEEIKPRFSYCCGVWYMMRHPMLLDAMDKLIEKHPSTELMLILSGQETDIELFKEKIKERKCANNITIRSKVPFDELNRIYQTSLGLIIPLDPDSVADIARFSQKIAEYIATGRPIITNAVGEIPYYFKDRDSAYFADYTADGFYEVMNEMMENKETADRIGHSGFMVGREHFDSNVNAHKMLDFISKM
ncbi:MAG: glycosyltransferase family 4 protein [Bacteroidaceae bacterium]|nr:glycosyltransferase family 4 protein [Bacteroidaceae bacterium]